MHKFGRLVGVWLITIFFSLGPGLTHLQAATTPRNTRYVVHFRDGTTRTERGEILNSSNADVARVVGDDTVAVKAAGDEVIENLEGSPDVESVHKDAILHAFRVPDDPCFSTCVMNDGTSNINVSQWNLHDVDAEDAWDITTGSSSVKVAVLDTGVDDHQQLAGKVTSSPSFVTGSAHTDDQNGHGTHVAGIIGALTDDNTDMASLGWNTSVYNVRVLSDAGSGYASDIAEGLRFAADQGIKIANMSLGGPVNDPELEDAIEYAQGKGVLIIAAAGNGSSNLTAKTYPAAYKGVVSVAASTSTDKIASYSFRGDWVDIAAPGSNILSTVTNDEYALEYGTSMASPHVAAAAALLKAEHPGATAGNLALRLFANADPISGTGKYFRYGRLNVYRALRDGIPAVRAASVKGRVYSLGSAESAGSLASTPGSPIVAMANMTTGSTGYWLASSSGKIYSFGTARGYGQVTSSLAHPVVGMDVTPSSKGYWLVTSDGKVKTFGDAKGYGQITGSLASPIVAIRATKDGKGYWLVSSKGKVFDFGNAHNYGSATNLKLKKPVFDMVPTATSNGYWLVTGDGAVASYGAARFYGSASSYGKTIVGMKRAPSGSGYWILSSGGHIYEFGSAVELGNAGSAGGTLAALS